MRSRAGWSRAIGAAVAAALLAAACGDKPTSSADNGRVDVVAAFYPLAEAARQVGGPEVHVDDLTPAGAEPHDLEVTTKQVDALQDADLVVAMGHGFQPAVEDVAKKRESGTVFMLDNLPIEAGDKKVAAEGSGTGLDPHVWLDPVLMKKIVQVVEEQLADADPDHGATYAANAARYVSQLDALDQEYQQGLAHCQRKEIVTSHEAFGWLARRYGLEQHAIAGISPDQEPSANRIAELSDLAKRDGVTTIFTETLVSPKVAQTLAREAGGLQTKTLDPLEGLTDGERKQGADYVSVMQDNLQTLRTALDCT
jgi:zinc transport system substrate-binding protein